MKSLVRRSHLAALITAMVACVCQLILSTAPVWAKVGSITEFPHSSRLGGPDFITAGPDGNLWFTDFGRNNIGRITPNGSFPFFPIPSFHSNPFDIAAGPDGNLWFTEENAGKVGRITTK